MTNLPLRGALIGAGEVSTFHLYAWQRLPQATIVAVADPNLESARRRAAEAGLSTAHAYPDLEQLLLAEPDLDFVDLAAPPETHLDLVAQAAARGLHVCCQKPFAPSLAAARQMIAVAEATGVLLHIHENWRWRSWYREVRRLLLEGEIGRPVYARIFSHSGSWLPGTEHDPDHRFLRWERAILYDWGTHHVDVLRFLFGNVATVYARNASVSELLDADDRSVVVLTFRDRPDMTAMIDLSWSSFATEGHPNRHDYLLEAVRIEGDRGTIELVARGPGDEVIRVTTEAGVREIPAYTGTPFDAYRQSYVLALGHFVTSLLAGTPTETPAADNYETLAATLAAYESTEGNRVVDVATFAGAERGP